MSIKKGVNLKRSKFFTILENKCKNNIIILIKYNYLDFPFSDK